jgi:ABC-type antimicrobial peptide transport system permease subunit
VTWLGLVRKNLFRRPARTLLTAAGVALGVALIVALLSITEGVHQTAGDLIHIGRADFGVFQSDVSDLTRSYLPDSLQARVQRVPGVELLALAQADGFGHPANVAARLHSGQKCTVGKFVTLHTAPIGLGLACASPRTLRNETIACCTRPKAPVQEPEHHDG